MVPDVFSVCCGKVFSFISNHVGSMRIRAVLPTLISWWKKILDYFAVRAATYRKQRYRVNFRFSCFHQLYFKWWHCFHFQAQTKWFHRLWCSDSEIIHFSGWLPLKRVNLRFLPVGVEQVSFTRSRKNVSWTTAWHARHENTVSEIMRWFLNWTLIWFVLNLYNFFQRRISVNGCTQHSVNCLGESCLFSMRVVSKYHNFPTKIIRNWFFGKTNEIGIYKTATTSRNLDSITHKSSVFHFSFVCLTAKELGNNNNNKITSMNVESPLFRYNFAPFVTVYRLWNSTENKSQNFGT